MGWIKENRQLQRRLLVVGDFFAEGFGGQGEGLGAEAEGCEEGLLVAFELDFVDLPVFLIEGLV